VRRLVARGFPSRVSFASFVIQLLREEPAVEHRRVDGNGPPEAQLAERRVVERLPVRRAELGAPRGPGVVALHAEQRFGTQRALHDFIHLGVHLHAALPGVRLLERRRRCTGVHLGQDGLAELQVVEARHGDHEAALSLPPAAVLSRDRADAVRWKRRQEPLHAGAMKPVEVIPAGI